MVNRLCVACALLALAWVTSAWAQAPVPVDDALRARLAHLETELRCLVCQNQTLADSNAPLAEDLRREVRELASAGKSDDQIRDYLVARYGEFVLYKPRVRPLTWALWFGPFVLLAVGALAWWRAGRRRADAAPDDDPDPGTHDAPANDTALERAREALQ
ncbi:MAG: cytochrome c-type biogenesis protein CcmH [Proteobacteria bacterium]|nr:cytochrome c-type biogenesis protein CcmH [Pseudomonadota bacterium]